MLWNLNSPIHFGDFSWCLTHLSFCELVIPCRPSPCTRLSLARTTTEVPLPYRIFKSFLYSCLFQRSDLGNPQLVLLITISTTYCRMRLSFLSAYCGCVIVGSLCSALTHKIGRVLWNNVCIIVFRCCKIWYHWTIVQPIKASSLCMSFRLAPQSPPDY